MQDSELYRDIAERTGGDLYLGVVGPVRTGKSTFIKKFMETMVLPFMEDVYQKERAKDALPQSGSGKTITTVEPKFVPDDAASIRLGNAAECRVRLIDSVGFMVPGASGNLENGVERVVMTPWCDKEIPMSQAAEEGTYRVIAEHSTIGILMTTDGSICGIGRDSYAPAEEKAAAALDRAKKPYLIILNCADPLSTEAKMLASDLSGKYGHTCLPLNCKELTQQDLCKVMQTILYEFPLHCCKFSLPVWMDALENSDCLRAELFEVLKDFIVNVDTVGEAVGCLERIRENEKVENAEISNLSLGTGTVTVAVSLLPMLYYQIISRESGFEIQNDSDLMRLLRSVSSLKTEYERFHDALEEVRTKGYGIVMPTAEEMTLEEPQLVRRGGRYGVHLKATAPSIHLVRADIETEVSPAIGGEGASEEVIDFLLQGYDGDMRRIWESNIFGKSLNDIAGEGLMTKLKSMPNDAQVKLRRTIARIVNDGTGGMICILL